MCPGRRPASVSGLPGSFGNIARHGQSIALVIYDGSKKRAKGADWRVNGFSIWGKKVVIQILQEVYCSTLESGRKREELIG